MTEDGDRDSGSANRSKQSASADTIPVHQDVSVRRGVQETILHDDTDGRKRYQWVSAYPSNAKFQIWCETAFVTLVLAAALTGIYLTWYGTLTDLLACKTCSPITLRRYSYFFFSGMLGSILFGGKYLYHVVARGYWHQDRRLWRVLSPFLAASLAVVIAAAIDSGMLGISFRAGSHAACVAMGFFSGYFADKALAKMSEISDVVFGVRDVGRNPSKHENTTRHEKTRS
jgi:hypothetical protein